MINPCVSTVIQLAPINEYLGMINKFITTFKINAATENCNSLYCLFAAAAILEKYPPRTVIAAPRDRICNDGIAGAYVVGPNTKIIGFANTNSSKNPILAIPHVYMEYRKKSCTKCLVSIILQIYG